MRGGRFTGHGDVGDRGSSGGRGLGVAADGAPIRGLRRSGSARRGDAGLEMCRVEESGRSQ